MSTKRKRWFEASMVIVAILLVVATSPPRYFLGQESTIPTAHLDNDTPAIALRAVIRFENEPTGVEPCFATFNLSAQNNSADPLNIHYWSLAGPWKGTFPPEIPTGVEFGAGKETLVVIRDEELFSGEIGTGDRDGTLTLNTMVSFEVACQWRPFNFLVFAESEGELDVDISGTLRVDTSVEFFPEDAPSSPLSCGGTEVDDTDERIRIEWL